MYLLVHGGLNKKRLDFLDSLIFRIFYIQINLSGHGPMGFAVKQCKMYKRTFYYATKYYFFYFWFNEKTILFKSLNTIFKTLNKQIMCILNTYSLCEASYP